MRYCRNCRKWNVAEPTRCRYCGAGLEGRLCPSGHVNPPNAGLVFCGECGKPLEKTWGAGFSLMPYLVGAGVLIVTFVVVLVVSQFGRWYDPAVSGFIILVILILGLRLSFRIVPPWVRNLILDTAHFLLHLVFGTGNKGRK